MKNVTEWAREIGYKSVSHDLVLVCHTKLGTRWNLPSEKTLELKPDRLAFYSYAHVPWIKGVGQRGFDENDLPSGEEKNVNSTKMVKNC